MIHIFGWIFFLLFASAGIFWMSEHPGSLSVEWMGYRVDAAIGIVIAATAVAFIVLFFLLMLLRSLLRTPVKILNYKEKSADQKGIEALTQTLVALASQDMAGAQSGIKKAEKYLPGKPVTDLLQAVVAYRDGDNAKTQKHLQKMLKAGETRHLASKSLIHLSRRDGKMEEAISHARAALAEAPGDERIILSLYDLYLSTEQWQNAEHLIRKSRRFKRISAATAARLSAVLHYLQARSLSDEKDTLRQKQAAAAFKEDTSFTPGVLLYLQNLRKHDKKMLLPKRLQQAWVANPHPAIADILLDNYASEDVAKLAKRLEKLAESSPKHPESRLLAAKAAMLENAWERARNILQELLTTMTEPRVYNQLSELERLAGNEPAGIKWMKKASDAGYDSCWHCNRCATREKEWKLHCSHCGAFLSIHWGALAQASEREGLALLPLE